MCVGSCSRLSFVQDVLTKEGPDPGLYSGQPFRFGVVSHLPSLATVCWSRHQLVFQAYMQSANSLGPPSDVGIPTYPHGRTPSDLLARHPVDVLVVDLPQGNTSTPETELPPWFRLLDSCPPALRPRIVIQAWDTDALWEEDGPASKSPRKALERLNYDTRFRVFRGRDHGSPVDQDRLIVISYTRIGSPEQGPTHPDTEAWEINQTPMGPRAMSNCLRPTGAGMLHDSLPRGSRTDDEPPLSTRDPMPPACGRWIKTPKGYRRLHADELAKGLGVPKAWVTDDRKIRSQDVNQLTSLHIWEGVTNSISSQLQKLSPAKRKEVQGALPASRGSRLEVNAEGKSTSSEWSWTPPSLKLSGRWYRNRLRNLKKAVKTYPPQERSRMIEDGKRDLARHRGNYGPDGPRHLQILWWEFPREHWEPLRSGGSMNFLKEPRIGFTPNSNLTPEQREIGGEFADELISLGVLEEAPADDPVVATCPLFVVPKPGQPGQWRVIADCKKGGQNEAMGPGPVYLPQAHVLLHQMYTNGWTAVVDASKMFYQFPTVISERRYLGLIHPVTGLVYRYKGLPMGSTSSPSLACRYGAGFLRRLRERHPDLFGGKPVENTWRRLVSEGTYEGDWGHGRVEVGTDGLPKNLLSGFVDDFAVHGPTKDKTSRGLTAFMDFAVEVGFLVNPKKVDPPSQTAKYIGFIFDTQGTPTLRIPPVKRSRARAMVAYLLQQRGQPVPRLVLSVVTGVLEALVPATPSRIGHTYLRRLYDCTWMDISDQLELPRDRYYEKVSLDEGAWLDLTWWHDHLLLASGQCARPHRTSTLVAHFGDGSGTGTGGTNEVLGDPKTGPKPMEMWMGRWEHCVHQFSSNWRELKTLETTLKRELARPDSRSRDCTLFYFTDNSTTYHVVNGGSSRSPGLHELVYSIKTLEIRLRCMLEVVHVPGTTLISQGADDLSRGVWVSPHRSYIPAKHLIPALFGAVHLQAGWHGFLRSHVSGLPDTTPTMRSWADRLEGDNVLHQFTVWSPPVEMATQIISGILTLWTESPEDTSALILLPRVLQRQWQRMSRHIQKLSPRDPESHSREHFLFTDPSFPVYHHLPIFILYLAPFVPSLPRDRLDQRSASHVPQHVRRWYEARKQHLYRLPLDDSP